jgi:hypothetical protein
MLQKEPTEQLEKWLQDHFVEAFHYRLLISLYCFIDRINIDSI